MTPFLALALAALAAMPSSVAVSTDAAATAEARAIGRHLSERVRAVWGLRASSKIATSRERSFRVRLLSPRPDRIAIEVSEGGAVFAIRELSTADLEAAKVGAWLAAKSAIQRALVKAPLATEMIAEAPPALPPPPVQRPRPVAIAAAKLPDPTPPIPEQPLTPPPPSPSLAPEPAPPAMAAPLAAEPLAATPIATESVPAPLAPPPEALPPEAAEVPPVPAAEPYEGWSIDAGAVAAFAPNRGPAVRAGAGVTTTLGRWLLLGGGADYQRGELGAGALHQLPIHAFLALRSPLDAPLLAIGVFGALDLKLAALDDKQRIAVGVELGPIARLRLPLVALGSGELGLLLDGAIGLRLRRQVFLFPGGDEPEAPWSASVRTAVDWRWR